jgi:hypothetical protein
MKMFMPASKPYSGVKVPKCWTTTVNLPSYRPMPMYCTTGLVLHPDFITGCRVPTCLFCLAFRLKRNAMGVFRVASYQPLPRTTKITAAAWNAANGKLYVGFGRDLRTYDYARNDLGRAFRVPNLTDITGMTFSPDGRFLLLTTGDEQLRRVRWATKRLVAGWTFGLRRFGIHDSRAVEAIAGRYYVSDGDDARSNADPLKYAVYVLRLR